MFTQFAIGAWLCRVSLHTGIVCLMSDMAMRALHLPENGFPPAASDVSTVLGRCIRVRFSWALQYRDWRPRGWVGGWGWVVR